MNNVYLICFVPSTYQNNVTAVYVASQNNHHSAVLSLLGAGANVNTATYDVSDVMVTS